MSKYRIECLTGIIYRSPEDDGWIGHCLELDLIYLWEGDLRKTSISDGLAMLCHAHIEFAMDMGMNPYRPAPQVIWDKFSEDIIADSNRRFDFCVYIKREK